MELSCTSVMLPRWGLDETFDKLQAYGYDAVELRCRYNPDDPNVEPSFWGRHLSDVSPDNINGHGRAYSRRCEPNRPARRRAGAKLCVQ